MESNRYEMKLHFQSSSLSMLANYVNSMFLRHLKLHISRIFQSTLIKLQVEGFLQA